MNADTLSCGLSIANKGLEQALKDDVNLMNGLNIYDGKCTNEAVAKSLGIAFTKAGAVVSI